MLPVVMMPEKLAPGQLAARDIRTSVPATGHSALANDPIDPA
jgi:hypothetical protein